uniref:Tetratricopeptide repeat protein 39B n=1 Tax=Arcella intermedia TaxID=1963864 RepID=A0A6B2L1T5_9EUKA
MWQTDIEGSQQVLREAYEEDPSLRQNAWCLAAEAEIVFYKYNGDETVENETDLLNKLKEIEKAANVLYTQNVPSGLIERYYTNKQTDSSLFLEALTLYAYYYLCLSMINFRKQERVKGSYYFRKSWKYFEKCSILICNRTAASLTSNPKIVGLVNFGCGLFHFLTSLIPPSMQFIVTLVGFVGDRKHALVEIESCVASGCTKSIEASMILAILKKYFTDEQKEGDAILEKLQHNYSDSHMINYLCGFICRTTGEIERSIAHFQKCSYLTKEKLKSIQLFTTTQYHLGYCTFLQNDWEEASKYFKNFLDQDATSTGKRFRPYASYLLGFCYWKLNTKDIIPALYKEALTWVREEQSYDIYAKRKIQQFLEQNKFSEFDELAIPIMALLEGKQYETANKHLKELLPIVMNNKTNGDLLGTYFFMKAGISNGLKICEKAKKLFMKVIKLEKEIFQETYLVPYSWLYLGEIEMEQENWENAKNYFSKAKGYTNYDWAQLISFRLFSNSQKLETRMKQQ